MKPSVSNIEEPAIFFSVPLKARQNQLLLTVTKRSQLCKIFTTNRITNQRDAWKHSLLHLHANRDKEEGRKYITIFSIAMHTYAPLCFTMKEEVIIVGAISIWSASYSLEKNLGSGEGVTNFRNRARTCTELVHIISNL